MSNCLLSFYQLTGTYIENIFDSAINIIINEEADSHYISQIYQMEEKLEEKKQLVFGLQKKSQVSSLLSFYEKISFLISATTSYQESDDLYRN